VQFADAGWFPFCELSPEDNDIIFQARLAGYGPCFAAFPTSQAQADRTLAGAKKFLDKERT
jgi:hypothetical protein